MRMSVVAIDAHSLVLSGEFGLWLDAASDFESLIGGSVQRFEQFLVPADVGVQTSRSGPVSGLHLLR